MPTCVPAKENLDFLSCRNSCLLIRWISMAEDERVRGERRIIAPDTAKENKQTKWLEVLSIGPDVKGDYKTGDLLIAKTFGSVGDFAGVKIGCVFEEDIYFVYRPLPGESDDRTAGPVAATGGSSAAGPQTASTDARPLVGDDGHTESSEGAQGSSLQ